VVAGRRLRRGGKEVGSAFVDAEGAAEEHRLAAVAAGEQPDRQRVGASCGEHVPDGVAGHRRLADVGAEAVGVGLLAPSAGRPEYSARGLFRDRDEPVAGCDPLQPPQRVDNLPATDGNDDLANRSRPNIRS